MNKYTFFFFSLLLISSCSINKKSTNSDKIKSEEYIIKSDIGHQIKVETEFKSLTKEGGIEGCVIGCILTNIGTLDLKTPGYYYKDKYITLNEYQQLPLEEAKKVRVYIPEIVFEVTTSDEKVIDVTKYIEALEVGKSSQPISIRTNTSFVGKRYCVSIKPIKIKSKN